MGRPGWRTTFPPSRLRYAKPCHARIYANYLWAVLGGRFGVSVAFGLRRRIIRIVWVVRIVGVIWIRRIRVVVGIRAKVEEVQDGVIVVVSEDSLIPADHVMAAVIGVIFGGGVDRGRFVGPTIMLQLGRFR